jgi:hypothetical protein
MTIVLSWLLLIAAVAGAGYLTYKFVISLPSTVERYVRLREELKRERLKTEKLELEVLNEQLKDPDS